MPTQHHEAQTIDIALLKSHPVNEQLYEEDECEDLVDSIKKEGLKVPPIISTDNEIISGHRRVKALKILGWESVTCQVKEYASENAKLRDLIVYNLYRLKTNEQKIREGIMLEELYKEEKGSYGKPIRDIIGEKMGISGRSYADGKEVVVAMDSMKSSDIAGYKKVKNSLNKSILAGKKALSEETDTEKPELSVHYEYWHEFCKVINQLKKSYSKLADTRNHTTPLALGDMIGNLKDFADRIETWAPENLLECPQCNGTGRVEGGFCKNCIKGKVGLSKKSNY